MYRAQNGCEQQFNLRTWKHVGGFQDEAGPVQNLREESHLPLHGSGSLQLRG
jgi:hypothetical protein